MAAPIKECKVHFEPKQDLNGYSKPWVGGSGKNLFNINAPEQDPSDTTVTNTTVRVFTPGTYTFCASWSNWRDTARILSYSISNNTLTVNSTTGYGVGFALAVAAETSYAVSCTITGNGGHVNIAYYDAAGNYLTGASDASDINNTVVTTPADAAIAVLVFIGSYSDTPVTFSNIQFEKGAAVTSYEPYENICPISGWDSVKITKCGKNLLPSISSSGTSKNITYTLNTDGSYLINGTSQGGNAQIDGQVNGFKWDGSTELYMSGCPANGGDNKYLLRTQVNGWRYSTYDIGEGNLLQQRTNNITTDPIHFSFYVFDGVTVNNLLVKPMLEVGNTATDYEPYNGITIPITFPSEAGTIYGGYVDLVTGEIWKTWDIIDLGTCTWIQYNNNPSIFYTRNLSNLKEHSYQYTVLCTAYPYEQQKNVTATNDKTINDSQQLNLGNVAIRDTNYTNSTPAEFKEAMSGIICAYKLATPILIATLIPTQLKTLRGTNNIWSNSNGDITVQFWRH